MPRTTVAKVKALFPNENVSEEVVQMYIDDASLLVDEVLGASTLSDGRLEMIERYLAAHYYMLGAQGGGIFKEKIGESEETRGSASTLGQGLKLTMWGQQALGLDTTGGLAQIEGGSNKTALFRLV